MKTASCLFLFLWLRATFPRYRYDQIMRLGWKVFIPVTWCGCVHRRLDDVSAVDLEVRGRVMGSTAEICSAV
jgi:hypothetical protein